MHTSQLSSPRVHVYVHITGSRLAPSCCTLNPIVFLSPQDLEKFHLWSVPTFCMPSELTLLVLLLCRVASSVVTDGTEHEAASTVCQLSDADVAQAWCQVAQALQPTQTNMVHMHLVGSQEATPAADVACAVR